MPVLPLSARAAHFHERLRLCPYDDSRHGAPSAKPQPAPDPWRAHLPQRWRTLDELGVGAAVLQSQVEALGAKLKVIVGALQMGRRKSTIQRPCRSPTTRDSLKNCPSAGYWIPRLPLRASDRPVLDLWVGQLLTPFFGASWPVTLVCQKMAELC